MPPPLLPSLLTALVATSCTSVIARRSPEPVFDATTSCARLARAWRDHHPRPDGRASEQRHARAFVERALACRAPELVFEGFMVGAACDDAPACRAADGHQLARLARDGVPLKAAFTAWLAARDLSALGASIPYGADEPYRSLRETVGWLTRSAYREFARPIAELALAQHDPNVQATLLEYFVGLALPEGDPIARRLLAQADPDLRLHACVAMQRLGSPSSLPVVRAAATTDPYSRLVVIDGVEQEVFPVRARCADAAGAMRARAAGRPSVAAAAR